MELRDNDVQTHTHTRLTALCPELPGWAGTRKVKPIWILLKQETASGSSISWSVCKSALRSRQITTPAPHHSDNDVVRCKNFVIGVLYILVGSEVMRQPLLHNCYWLHKINVLQSLTNKKQQQKHEQVDHSSGIANFAGITLTLSDTPTGHHCVNILLYFFIQ